MLTENGASITKAYDGKQAVDIWKSSKTGEFDLILLDLMMPVMTGTKAARLIRDSKRFDAETIPIVAMTANTFDEDISECKKSGMNGYLAKPLDAAELIKLIVDLKNNK